MRVSRYSKLTSPGRTGTAGTKYLLVDILRDWEMGSGEDVEGWVERLGFHRSLYSSYRERSRCIYQGLKQYDVQHGRTYRNAIFLTINRSLSKWPGNHKRTIGCPNIAKGFHSILTT